MTLLSCPPYPPTHKKGMHVLPTHSYSIEPGLVVLRSVANLYFHLTILFDLYIGSIAMILAVWNINLVCIPRSCLQMDFRFASSRGDFTCLVVPTVAFLTFNSLSSVHRKYIRQQALSQPPKKQKHPHHISDRLTMELEQELEGTTWRFLVNPLDFLASSILSVQQKGNILKLICWRFLKNIGKE